MSCRPGVIAACCLVLASATAAGGEPAGDHVALIVAAGRPLRVRLNQRVKITKAGQVVTATVVDPVYAYDRIVIPSGATVTGHVARFDVPSRWSRARTMLAGNFTPQRTPILQFDQLALADGTTMPIATMVGAGRENITLSTTTAAPKTSGVLARGKDEAAGRARAALAGAKQRVHDAVADVKAPGRMQRLKEAAINQLPYHPQYLSSGTLYLAELVAPVPFGNAPASDRAGPGDRPPPQSVLTARLVTPVDSAKTPKGTPVQAVLTEPLYSANHRLIFPEGTSLAGEVTFAKPAASMHRNGQVRFLIERVQPPEAESAPLLASLYAVEARQDDRIVVDDEGGAGATSSKTRFIAPVLAIMSVHGAAERHHRHFDNDADDNEPISGRGHVGGRGVAGWFGFGLLGAGLGQIARPAAVALGVYGAARTTYTNVLGKGRDVVFPANTYLKVQLPPAAEPPER
jgi:hypothetical protein